MGEVLVVLGGGGHGAVVIATARRAGFDVVGVFDDLEEMHATDIMGVPVRGSIADAESLGPVRAVVAIGDNVTRAAVVRRTSMQMATIVHPDASVAEGVVIGKGSVVFAGVTIQPRTTIGRHAIINSGSVVDHDCRIGDFVHVAPGATICGDAQIGRGAFIGAGATVVPHANVGRDAVVGSGAVVRDPVAFGAVVAGVPARPIGER